MMSGVQTANSVLEEREHSRPYAPVSLLRADEVPARAREGVAVPNHYRFRHEIIVQGDELDGTGRVGAASCLCYMDRGRVESIEGMVGHPSTWLERFAVNVYRLDLRMGADAGDTTPLVLRSGLRSASLHRAGIDQRLLNESGEPVCEATIEVLFLDAERGLVPVPSSLSESMLEGEACVPPQPFLPMKEHRWSSPVRVYFEDTDTLGIVYHANYARFCRRAIAALVPNSHRVRIQRLSMRFMNASVLGDHLEVHTLPISTDQDQLTVRQQLVRVSDGQRLVDVHCTVSFHDPSGAVTSIPAALALSQRRRN